MININKYFNSIINKSPKSIKNGDIVRFSIVRKIDNDKAIVNIMGNKVIAMFKNGITEKGFALVSKENNKLILNILKNANSVKEAKENIKNGVSVNISSAGKENSEIANLLLSKGIKVNNQNIIYYERVLKYLPNNEKKEFFLNVMKNNIYFSEEEIKNLENIFGKIGNFASIIKNSNKNYKLAEILKNMIFNLKNHDKEKLKNYIDTNGYFAIWFALFDTINNDLDFDSENNLNNKEIIMFILKILSLNRKDKNNSFSYLIPIPFIADNENELKEILLYINGDKENKYNFNFVVYDNDKELCKIVIEKIDKEFKKEYLITLKLFDKKLYKKCNDTKYIIEEQLKIFEDLNFKLEYDNGA